MKTLIISSFGGGLALSAILLITVFATGQTFGQRCDSAGYTGHEWETCVSRLAQGGTE